MSQTYTQNVVHIVFSTKDRRGSIPNELGPRLWTYMTGICANFGIKVHAVRGTADHAHLLIQLPPTVTLAKAVLTIKANSSRWMGTFDRAFAWQKGYAAFSVSHSMIPTVARYINNQEKHHAKAGFDAEFVSLLKKHEIEFEQCYVFG